MAEQNYEQLLQSIGFPAADLAREAGIVGRKREVGLADVTLQGEEERRQMMADYEGRGVLNSGQRTTGIARQQAMESNKRSAIDVAAAEDLFNAQRQMEREKAAKEAEERQFALQKQMFDAQMAQSNYQFNAQMAASNAQLQQQQAYQRELDLIRYSQNAQSAQSSQAFADALNGLLRGY